MEPLKGGKVPIEILVRSKDAEENAKQFEKCLDVIKGAGKKVGVISKDTATGPFADEWKKAFGDISKEVEEVDISGALSSGAFAVKDENELRSMRNASRACTALLQEYFVEEMSAILDAEKNVTHKQLADKMDSKLDDDKFWKNLQKTKIPADFDRTQLDFTYGPTIQSGGAYDLKLSAQADSNTLHPGVIIAGLGLRYKSYASIVTRTFLVDPDKSQDKNYKLLRSIQETLIQEAREGVMIKDLYNKALGIIKTKAPELEKHFLKNIGGGIGFETRDTTLLINAKNTRQLKDGMTLNVSPGFTDLENPKPKDKKEKTYTLALSDTIRVRSKEEAANFTSGAAMDHGAISFYFKDDDEEDSPQKSRPKKDSKIGAVASSNVVKSKLRAERTKQVDDGAEARRREHQKELAGKKQQEGMRLYAEATGDANGVTQKKFKRFESYKRDNQFPSRVADLQIVVDIKASTVVLPIMGRPVPFHINTIKNASNSDEGEFSYLRINLLSPGQGVGRKDDQPFEDASAHFIRSLTFRSTDADRMQDIAQQITDLRKNAVRREQEKKEMEDVVEQDKLTVIRSKYIGVAILYGVLMKT